MTNGSAVLSRKGDTQDWRNIEKIYMIVKTLEDGCDVNDIRAVWPEQPVPPLDRISSALSKICLAHNTPFSFERFGFKYKKIKAIAPLPDILFDDPMRERRGRDSGAHPYSEEEIAKLDRAALLQLKMKINKRLSELPQ